MIISQKGRASTPQRTMWEDWRSVMLFYRYNPHKLVEVRKTDNTFSLTVPTGSNMYTNALIGIDESLLDKALGTVDRLYIGYDEDNEGMPLDYRFFDTERKVAVIFADFMVEPYAADCALGYDPLEPSMFWLVNSQPAILVAKNIAKRFLPSQDETEYGIGFLIKLAAAYYNYSTDGIHLPFTHVKSSSIKRVTDKRSCYLSECVGGEIPHPDIKTIVVDASWSSSAIAAFVVEGKLMIKPQHGAEGLILSTFDGADLILD